MVTVFLKNGQVVRFGNAEKIEGSDREDPLAAYSIRLLSGEGGEQGRLLASLVAGYYVHGPEHKPHMDVRYTVPSPKE